MFSGFETGGCGKPSTFFFFFSLLINDLANEIMGKAKHGIPLGPTEIELFILLFADDLSLLDSTVIGLQNQLNALSVAAKRLVLTVNLDKSKVMVFRKGGYLAAKERLFWDDEQLEVVNTYKYLALFFSFLLDTVLQQQWKTLQSEQRKVQ